MITDLSHGLKLLNHLYQTPPFTLEVKDWCFITNQN